MAILDKDTVDKYLDRDDGNTLISRYLNEALASINNLTCNAVTYPAVSQSELTGIVGDDGYTVRVSAWVSHVYSVTDSHGKSLGWNFSPAISDLDKQGNMGTKYGHSLILTDRRSQGETLTVTCDYGFDTLPSSLAHALIVMMGALEGRQTGSDAIKSKSIEDVSVTADTKTGQTPEQIAMSSMQSTIAKWTLCDDPYRLGVLAYPDPQPSYPYYLSAGDLGGGPNHVIGSVHG